SETLERLGPRIEALREQEPWLKTLRDRTAELQAEITELESQLALERRQFGLREDKTSSVPTLNASALQVLRHPARAMKQAHNELAQAERVLEEVEQRALTLSEKVDKDLAGWGVDDLGLALQRQGDAVSRLRRRAQMDQRIDQMETHQAELNEQGRSLAGNQLMPIWVSAAIALGVVLGTGLFFGLGMVTESGFGLWGWFLAFWLVAGATSMGLARRFWERSQMNRLKACRRQATMLASQIDEARREREKLDGELPRGDGTIQERLKDAERHLADLEAFVGRDAQRLSAQEEAETAARRLEDAKRALAQAKNRWRSALVSSGLPADLAPGQIRSLVSRSEEMADIRRRLEHRQEELQQRNRELEGLRRRIAEVVAEAGLSASAGEPVEGLQALTRALAEQQAQQKRLGELRSYSRRMRRKRKKIDKSVRQLKAYRRRLFRAVGTADEAEFRRRAEHFAQIESLRANRAAIAREIAAAVGVYCPEEAIGQALEGQTGETLRARCDQLRGELAGVEKRLLERCEQRGRLAEQLRVLSDDRAPGAKQLEMNTVEQQLADALHRWRVRAVAFRTLAAIRESYQRDRQPETLQEASDYLERLTQGRYTRVWTPLDEDVLLVDDAEGKPRSVDILSQGTREQLFICLRLALVAGYARRGTVLPLILDDVLVNFDVQRAKAAAEVMRDFAATGHQLLVFTCHEHIQKLFKSLKVPVDELATDSGSARPAAARPKATRAKIAASSRSKPKPQPAAQPESEPEEILVEEPIPEPEVLEPLAVAEPDEEDADAAFDAGEDEPEEDENLWDEEDEEEPAEDDWEEADEEEDEEMVEEEASDDWDMDEDLSDEDDGGEDDPDEDEYGEEEDEEVEDSQPKPGRRRRRSTDDWDDRYEDEYDQLYEESDDQEADSGEDEDAEDYGDDDGGAEAA
ncbi:MAG: ATP-binding protein, partial [Thermoguttaceae bacterium]